MGGEYIENAGKKADKRKGRTDKLDGYFLSLDFTYIFLKSSPLSAKLLTPRKCHQACEGIVVKGVVTVPYA